MPNSIMLFKNNCCHTYSIVLLLHQLTLVSFNSHELYQDSIHTLVNHKDFINYVLLSQIFSNHIDLFQQSSQIHIS
jgi:hypothetical protein